MLTHLQIYNFTLVEEVELSFSSGLTVLTGETGAGKSVLLEGLGLALGGRAGAEKVRPGAAQAEVCATFDVSGLSHVQRWLTEAELGIDECIVRRLVTAEGRSRAFVNGRPVTLTQLRALGERLIDIHSQHEHQSLLKAATHRRLLDAYGQAAALVAQVKKAYEYWQQLSAEIEQVRSNSQELNARYQLLSYQVEELDQLDLQPGELDGLEAQQRQLANSEEIREGCQAVVTMCADAENGVEGRLSKALHLLATLPAKSVRLQEAEGMLQNALIQVQEANAELSRDLDDVDDDAFRLPEIEQRLSAIYEIARKHRLPPEELASFHESLAAELAGLKSGDDQLEVLEVGLKQALVEYQQHSGRLSLMRAKASKSLAKAVNAQLSSLAMERAVVDVALTPTTGPSRHGDENVEFLISTVPGQRPQSLIKIASGGELSRISLAIQVVTAKLAVIPVLVFDEVDVGIGGATGDVVGQLLRELGESAQVLCVTHLAQVASKAHHHLKVEKAVTTKGAFTSLTQLRDDDKVVEIARMMGGATESRQSLAHAREMLGQ